MCAEQDAPAACPSYDRLPAELLARTFAMLPFPAYLTCHRVSRKFLKTINDTLIYMPKTTVTSVNIEHADGKITLVVSRARYNSPRKTWSCVFVEDASTDCASTSEASPADFFDKQGLSGMKWDAASKSVEFRVPSPEESLANYMFFICSKAAITLLNTVNLSDDAARNLTQVLKSCGSRVFHLKMVLRRPMTTDVVDMIRQTRCETIDVRREAVGVVDLLFRNPSVIGKVWSLTLLGHADEPLALDDDFFLATTADTIDIRGMTAISVEGVRKLALQWLSGERKVENIALGAPFASKDLETMLKSLGAVESSPLEWQLRQKEEDDNPLTFAYNEAHELTIFAENDTDSDDDEDLI